MSKITLNSQEKTQYRLEVENKVASLPVGDFHFRDFFAGKSTPIRLARCFREDVDLGMINFVSYKGKDENRVSLYEKHEL